MTPLAKPDTCKGCVGYDWACPSPGFGFVKPQISTHWNGVLLVYEAAGEHESLIGAPLQGKAGQAHDDMLARGGMNRLEFDIANVLSCRPPNNYLVGAPYEIEATVRCRPYLDQVIEARRPRCIVAGGGVALSRLLPTLPVGIDSARGYVHRYRHRDGWETWCVPTVHPSRIARGQTALTAVFIHDVQKAVEIARDGFQYLDTDFYLLDPTPAQAESWVKAFEIAVILKQVAHLSSDIETPDKDANEDELEEAEEDVEYGEPDIKDRTYTIMRCGYSYHNTKTGQVHVLSMPWGGVFDQYHRRLIEAKVDHLWWNKSFDVPRIMHDGKMPGGVQHDGMESWHILNSDLKRSLGTVSSFLCPTVRMWKHLSMDEPPFYNGQDAYAADCNHIETVKGLHKHKLWPVYVEQILEMDPIWTSMTAAGMPIDAEKRLEFAKELTELEAAGRAEMQQVTPLECRRIEPPEGYKKALSEETQQRIREHLEPGERLVEWLFDAVEHKECSVCGMQDPKKSHFKSRPLSTCSCGKKWTATHLKHSPGGPSSTTEQNPCVGGEVKLVKRGTTRWARVQPFAPSPKQILAYMALRKHKVQYKGKGQQRKPTTDIKALKKIRAAHAEDPLYPLIIDDRKLSKLAGTYIGRAVEEGGVWKVQGGFMVGRDGRVRAQFTNAPSTGRTSMRAPNLQNLPR